MNLLRICGSMGVALNQLNIEEILQTNEQSSKHGLVLIAEEAKGLIEARNRAIQSHGRVEMGIEVIKKIIVAFCTSIYMDPEDYASTLNELIEVFYFMKNETEDRIGDDDLICIMQHFFDNSSRGSVELLKSRDMELFARNSRCQNEESEHSLEGETSDE